VRVFAWIGLGLVACQGAEPAVPADVPTSSPTVAIAPEATVLATATAAPGSSEAPPPRRAIRYLALGDSFTIGTGSTEADAFPAVFARSSACDVTLLNVARNGYTTDDVLARELPSLADFRPDLVTLGIGANDRVRGKPLASYRQSVSRILDAVLAAGVLPERFFLLPQPDWSRSPAARDFGDPAELAKSIVEMNAILKEEGARRRIRWLELDELMAQQAARGDLAPDHLHPSKGAHATWAAELVAAVCPR
jgi:lysophospholipase L1-like esterase